jgi:glycosyltransferase involved in cell wall biosynthesis
MGTTRAWHLPQAALGLERLDALSALWMADKNSTGLPPGKYVRCWPYHLAMKPFYHLGSQIWNERATYMMIGFWKNWVRGQMASNTPKHNIVHSVMGFASELFDAADKTGALKVLDCPNSHPTTYYGFWQRECDLWCPGERVPIPWWMFSRMNQELERADMIVVQSVFCRESMIWNGIPEHKIFVNPMGVDTSVFVQRASVPEKPRFICVGTICLRKGHQYLFRAFEKVRQHLPDAELICVGDYKRDFRMERSHWEGTFTHYPNLSHSELAELLRGSTAFVFPSQEEGIARAQIEALASGLPVIGTHEGGATTLIRDGEEGFIVRGRDPEHISQAMIRAASDPFENRRMGGNAHLKGGKGNSWQDYSNRLVEEYRARLNFKMRPLHQS